MILLVAAARAGPEVPPPNRLDGWNRSVTAEAAGTRVGVIVESTDALPVKLEVWDGARWIRLDETFREHDAAVMFADLSRSTKSLRFRTPAPERVRALDWDLFTPDPEPRTSSTVPPSPGVLPAELTAIGVVSRAAWGARDTTCSTLEDDWYRMAIHHSAGSQTYGGTVEGEVRVLQAYAQDSGEYCDIPYQFLVGYDGSLWEGRPYGYYSGATGGGNNDGNTAVCFLGCYHPTSCSTSHEVTDAMMEEGHLLVQTLVALHDIPSDSDSIRGHRDWPGNSTACPGDWLYDRLDELREPPGPDFAGVVSTQSFSGDAAVTLEVGQELSAYVELTNTGAESWTPGSTFLATIPRDVASDLADESWTSNTRAATVDAVTAPGETGRFSFVIQGNTVGSHDQYFGLVQEWVTWFADDGGPSDDQIHARVDVIAADSGTSTDSSPTVDDPSDPPSGAHLVSPGETVPFSEIGCGCAASPRAPWQALPALLLVGWRRRRRTAETFRE